MHLWLNLKYDFAPCLRKIFSRFEANGRISLRKWHMDFTCVIRKKRNMKQNIEKENITVGK